MAAPTLSTLPLILAGPMLRRVQKDSVAVWVALQKAATLKLNVKRASDGGTRLTAVTLPASTVKVGNNLFIAVVTATATGTGDQLIPGELYAYDLEATIASGSFTSLRNTGFFSRPNESYVNTQLAYPGMAGVDPGLAGLPTFVLPASSPDGLRILHGSCRRPHANSLDALGLVDKMLGSAALVIDRPQQLLLTGDQIYADDVGDALMHLIRQAVPVVVGTEDLPGVPAEQLAVGNRGPLTRDKAGFNYSKSHLLTFGEYVAMYLFVWSDTLWPRTAAEIPVYNQIYGHSPTVVVRGEVKDTPHFTEFKRERDGIVALYGDLAPVRRALANIASYMIIDDHEITDDFYLNREWLEKSLLHQDKTLSRRVVMDGLLAYMVCQGWGNEPTKFGPLLAQLTEWATANFPATGTLIEDLEKNMGLPTMNAAVPPNGEFARTDSPVWHYQIEWDCHEIIGLDTRTHRTYPPGTPGLEPPGTLSEAALSAQISATAPAWKNTTGGVSLLLVPSPMVPLSFVKNRQLAAREDRQLTRNRDADAPPLDPVSYDQLVFRLAARDGRRSRVVVLSGDVHYAYAGLLEYWSPKAMDNPANQPPAPDTRAVMAQLVASAFKNQSKNDDIRGSLALHYSGFRLSRKQVTRLGWKPTPAPTTPRFRVGEVEWPDRRTQVPTIKKANWDVSVDRGGFVSTDLERELDRFVSVTPTIPPDWRNRLTLIPPEPKSVSVTPVNDKPVTLLDLLAGFIIVIFNWLIGYTRVAKGGSDVVGVNNIASVTFRWGASDKAVIQQLHWWAKNYRDLYQARAAGQDASFLTITQAEASLEIQAPPPNEKIVF
jgi:hypothetical protein